MARKVFVSFLGTSNYVNCKYEFTRDEVSIPVRFIQEATINYVCKDWTEDDKILIFCTKKAIVLNWNDNGHVNTKNPHQKLEEIEKIGLQSRLQDTKYAKMVSMEEIPEGFSEEEIWDIFDRVYKKLQEHDELYFDVTHAFRSIPMFSTILFNYASFMKKIEIKAILYGAFEKLGTAYDVKQMSLDDRIAPILNLTNLIRLQQYTDIASSFTSFGRVRKLSETLRNETTKINSVVKQVYIALENFDNAILTNDIPSIEEGGYMKVLTETTKPLRRQNVPIPIREILLRLHNELKRFGFIAQKDFKNIEAAISWAKHYKMLPQSYTLGQEYIITRLVKKFFHISPFENKENGKKDFRLFMSAICSIGDEDVRNKNFKHLLGEYIEITEILLNEPIIIKIRPVFSQLGQKRNALNHGKGNVNYEELVKEFDLLFNQCLEIVNSDALC